MQNIFAQGRLEPKIVGDQLVGESLKLATPLPNVGLGGKSTAGMLREGACSPVSRSVARLLLRSLSLLPN
jgi:hypothetical protein